MLPGAPIPTPARSRGVGPGLAARRHEPPAEISAATASGPPQVGVSRRAAARTRAPRADDDRLDLRPPEVDARSQERRRTTSARGLRFARALHSSAAARRDVTEPLGDPEGEHDRDVLVLGHVERGPDPLGVRDPVRARRRARRSRRRAACSGPRDPRRTSPAPCPSRRSRRPARPSGCWSARKTVSAIRSRRSREVGTTNVHGWRFFEEPDSRPASRMRSTTSSGSGSGR